MALLKHTIKATNTFGIFLNIVPGGSRPSDIDIRGLLAELFNLVYKLKNRFWANTRFLFFGPIYDLQSTDKITLTAEVNFPNIEFSKADVDFGTILNDTDSAIAISMKNKSPLPVEFQWWFELDRQGFT